MKKLTVIVGILAVVALIGYSQRASIITRVMEVGMERNMGADLIAELEDGLHLALCGAGGPLPAPNASGPCVASWKPATISAGARVDTPSWG